MSILSICWLALAAGTAWRFRPVSCRRLSPLPPSLPRSRPRPLVAVGRTVRIVTRRPPDASADARVGSAVGWSLVGLLLSPALAVGLGVGRWVLGGAGARSQRRQRDARIVRELPEVVDLLVLGLSAGLSVPKAIAAVAELATGVVPTSLRHALGRVEMGERLADALESLPSLEGEALRPLVRSLAGSERYGVPLLPALERLAADVRAQRRRQAEVMARRLPVKLLFPLVLCILPAFALLTVVPVVASSLRSVQI
jgi:tight adherence protein C